MKCLWVLVYLVLSQGAGLCQGTMYKASEHHIGLLDFFNNHPFKNSNGKIPHPSPAANGMLNSKNGWYEEQGIKVRGLVESAALQVDWWMLFNEPTEQYEFQWVSSGKYDIQFTDNKGKPVSTTITRAQLEKYPDLLKRFNALQPTDMQFEIKWRIGDQTKADNDAFQKKYKLMGSIGSTLPHVKAEFTTQVKNSLLFEPSGIKPFAAPSIRPGKGKAFLGVPATYDDKKLQQVFAYWRISLGHVINSFRVTKANWPVQEMKTIAEKFLRYEKGEADPTPKEVVAAANEKNKNTPAYGKNDFWGDAVEEEYQELFAFNENSLTGFKNKKGDIVISGNFSSYVKSIDPKMPIAVGTYDFARNDFRITLYNTKGKKLEELPIKGLLMGNYGDFRRENSNAQVPYLFINSWLAGDEKDYIYSLKSMKVIFTYYGGVGMARDRYFTRVNVLPNTNTIEFCVSAGFDCIDGERYIIINDKVEKR